MMNKPLDLSVLHVVKDSIFFLVVHDLAHIQFSLKKRMCTTGTAEIMLCASSAPMGGCRGSFESK